MKRLTLILLAIPYIMSACNVKKTIIPQEKINFQPNEKRKESMTNDEKRTFISQARSVAFKDDSAWILTESGSLALTNSGGKDWQVIFSEATRKLGSLTFIGNSEGLALTSDGEILKTFDAGLSWGEFSSLHLKKKEIQNRAQIKFKDQVQGIIVIPPGQVWKTADGGMHWQELYPFESTKGMRCSLTGGISIKGDSIWLTAEPGIVFSSENGGAKWSYQKIQKAEGGIFDICFVSKEIGWLTGFPDLGVFKSTDSGNTWRVQLPFVSFYKNPGIISIFFINEREGWAIGQDKWKKNGDGMGRGIVLRTIDGGDTWRQVKVGKGDSIFSRVHFIDSKRGWIIDKNNVYHTEDGGTTWIMVKSLSP